DRDDEKLTEMEERELQAAELVVALGLKNVEGREKWSTLSKYGRLAGGGHLHCPNCTSVEDERRFLAEKDVELTNKAQHIGEEAQFTLKVEEDPDEDILATSELVALRSRAASVLQDVKMGGEEKDELALEHIPLEHQATEVLSEVMQWEHGSINSRLKGEKQSKASAIDSKLAHVLDLGTEADWKEVAIISEKYQKNLEQ
ncbi:hypothetical protein CYMTET_28016, partial [Cymbomonas tetramitiformis]